MRTLEDVELDLLTKLKSTESDYATYKYIWENCLINVENCRKELYLVKQRDPKYQEYKEVFLKSIEEEKITRDKFEQISTKLVTIRFKLSEVRDLLNRKRNHQSNLRSV